MAIVRRGADHGLASSAHAGLTAIGMGASVAVIAARLIGRCRVRYAGDRIACVDGARVAIVDDEGNPRDAYAATVACLATIANVAVRARGPDRCRRVLDARGGVAAIDRAWIVVVHDDRGPAAAASGAVVATRADIPVVAGGAIGLGRIRAHSRRRITCPDPMTLVRRRARHGDARFANPG